MAQSVGKVLVTRLVNEVMNQGRLDVIDDIYDPKLAPAVHRWIEPFLRSFSDVDMQIVQLVEEDDVVVGRFTCSGTHSAVWRGYPATNRRFHAIAEVYFFRVSQRRIIWAWGLEDNHERLRQLGLN